MKNCLILAGLYLSTQKVCLNYLLKFNLKNSNTIIKLIPLIIIYYKIHKEKMMDNYNKELS